MVTLFWNFRGGLHVFLLFNRFFFKVLDHTVLYAPPQKVELGTRGRKTLEIDAFCTTKRVKKLLRVPIQARLVCYMNREHLPRRRGICHVIVLRIVGNEPLQFPKRNTLAVLQNIVKFLSIFWNIKKFC